MRLIRDKCMAYNARVKDIAARHDCLHVDLWSMTVLADQRQWHADRLHLAADGHRRVALHVAEIAGLAVSEDWRIPLPPDPAGSPGWLRTRHQDLTWARAPCRTVDHAATARRLQWRRHAPETARTPPTASAEPVVVNTPGGSARTLTGCVRRTRRARGIRRSKTLG